MGTYKLRATSVSTKIAGNNMSWKTQSDSINNADLVASIFDPNTTLFNYLGADTSPSVETGQIRFNCEFYLDGSATPTDFNSLPAGFTLISAAVVADILIVANSSGKLLREWLQFDLTREMEFNFTVNGASIITYDYPSASLPSPAGLLSAGFGIRTDESPLIPTGNARWRSLDIQGEYSLMAWTFTFSDSGSEVEANTPGKDTVEDSNGTLITITSDPEDPDHLLLDELTISIECGAIIIKTQTETLFEFWIPSSCSGAGVQTITATGNGVQFSGSVALGTLDILLTNGSGLYVITPGNLHDVLYSSLRDGTTRNVKKPNPFIKSGFIGG